jgi:hypothetical protein
MLTVGLTYHCMTKTLFVCKPTVVTMGGETTAIPTWVTANKLCAKVGLGYVDGWNYLDSGGLDDASRHSPDRVLIDSYRISHKQEGGDA